MNNGQPAGLSILDFVDAELLAAVRDFHAMCITAGKPFAGALAHLIQMAADPAPRMHGDNAVDEYCGDLERFQEWCQQHGRSFRQEIKRLVNAAMVEPLADDDTEPPAIIPTPPRRSTESRGSRMRSLVLLCVERPGETFTLEQAAPMVGLSPSTLRQYLSPSKRHCQGDLPLHFYRQGEPAQAKSTGELPVQQSPPLVQEAPPIVQQQPDPAPIAGGHGNGRMVLCVEKPGVLLTVDEAANLAGCNRKRMYVRLAPSSQLRHGARIGTRGLHFHWEGTPSPITDTLASRQQLREEKQNDAAATLHEYQRRRGGQDVAPINPMRQGTSLDTTPPDIAADPISNPRLHKQLTRGMNDDDVDRDDDVD